MTTPTERAQAYLANELRPAPLPPPPTSEMVPLLPTPGVDLLPASPPPQPPGRAAADDRWDARRSDAVKAAPSVSAPGRAAAADNRCDAGRSDAVKAAPSVSVPGRAAADDRWDARKSAAMKPAPPSVSVPGRADAEERWDSRKVKPDLTTSRRSSNSPASPSIEKSGSTNTKKRALSLAESSERWDTHKVKPALTTSSSSASSSMSSNSPTTSSPWIQKWSSNKKRAISRAGTASSERWDAHKQLQPRPPKGRKLDDDGGESGAGSNDVEMVGTPPRQSFYAGPGFLVSPEASMLPMPPSFLLRAA